MPNRIFNPWTSGTAIFLLLVGMAHAQTKRFNERMDAITKQCRADQQGLTPDQIQEAQAKSLPKITSCPILRLAPGSTGEVVVRGTFQAGTTFLFDNDNVEVVKETFKPGTPESEYRATVKVAQGVSPGSAKIELYQPKFCQSAFDLAVSITGKYEYSLTGENGWRVTLKYAGEPETHSAGSMYHAGFYRPNESTPFRIRDILLTCQNDKFQCGGEFTLGQAEIAKLPAKLMDNKLQSQEPIMKPTPQFVQLQAEAAKLRAKLSDPKLPMDERMKLIQQISQLQQEMTKTPIASVSKSLQDNLKEVKEFGCAKINLDVKGQSVAGGMCCGQNAGGHPKGVCYDPMSYVDLKGTVKFLGP